MATNKKTKPKTVGKGLASIPAPKRPKTQELGLKGEGVEKKEDKQLTEWGDDFIDKRDAKATLVTELKALETKMLERMAVLGVTEYRFGDQILVQKKGATHVKIKAVKMDKAAEAAAGGEGNLGEAQ